MLRVIANQLVGYLFIILSWQPLFAQTLHNNHTNQCDKYDDLVFIFISMSMPQTLIQDYLRLPRSLNTKIILRGLVEQSFEKTTSAIRVLAEEGDVKRGIQNLVIDPLLFDAYDIERVPAVVVRSEKKSGQFDKVYGATTIMHALKLLCQGNGNAQVTACHLLESWP